MNCNSPCRKPGILSEIEVERTRCAEETTRKGIFQGRSGQTRPRGRWVYSTGWVLSRLGVRGI